MMKALMDLRDMLCKELDEEARKGELSAGSLETVHKITDTIKNIDKICVLEDEGGYSGDGNWNARGNYSRDGYMMADSYARGSYGRNSYDGGYSGARHYVRGHYSRSEGSDMLRDRINEMMRDGTMTDGERNILQRAMQVIANR